MGYIQAEVTIMRNELRSTFHVAVLFSLGLAAATGVIAADTPAATGAGESNQKLEVALTPTVRLLQLMDADKNGKISKQEFLHFMEAEFDFADKNHDGELDPKELQHLVYGLRHPIAGPAR
jgi:hypothetical protein